MNSFLLNIKDIYKYRALVSALVGRHLALRYRGSLLGFLWSFLNPLCLMLIYALVFRYYIRFDSVPNYTVFLFCGLLPWIWTSTTLIEGASSIVNSGHLITKSMFPAQILPAVSLLTNLVNFLLSLPILFIMLLIYGIPLHATILFLPVVLLIHSALLYALVIAISSLNVHYRDIQHIVGNLLSFLFFLCPIIYSESVVPDRFKFTLQLNPIALITTWYHHILMDGTLPSLGSIIYVCAFTVAAAIFGVMTFERLRESFAEML